MSDNIAFLSATKLAKLVRAKRISCLELLDLYVGRVERYNPSLNAIIAEKTSEARSIAFQRDAELAQGQCRGPSMGCKLNNAIVTADSLSPALLTSGMAPAFAWEAGKAYRKDVGASRDALPRSQAGKWLHDRSSRIRSATG